MRITCKTKDTLPLDALTEFQGGLKKRDDSDFEKIRKSIEKYGFATPFFVWKRGRANYVLDGHGRLETLKRMQADGAKIPPLPIVFVECKTEADAKNLLLRINSTYGRMTAESVIDFIGGIEIDIKEIALPKRIHKGVYRRRRFRCRAIRRKRHDANRLRAAETQMLHDGT